MSEPAELDAAERRVVDIIGRLMEFWGFKAVLGRIWATLYLSPEPMGAADIGERLSLSTGGVSMALTELLKWGVVRKSWQPGVRRDYFEAETSIWKMVSRVFRERELALVREASGAFDGALKLVNKARPKAGSDEKRRLRFVEERLRSLLLLSRIGEGLLAMLASGEPVDPKPFKRMFEGAD